MAIHAQHASTCVHAEHGLPCILLHVTAHELPVSPPLLKDSTRHATLPHAGSGLSTHLTQSRGHFVIPDSTSCQLCIRRHQVIRLCGWLALQQLEAARLLHMLGRRPQQAGCSGCTRTPAPGSDPPPQHRHHLPGRQPTSAGLPGNPCALDTDAMQLDRTVVGART